jgi:hypothetical protein
VEDVERYKQRHQDFWQLTETRQPLLGFTLGAGSDSWSYWQNNKAAQDLFTRPHINADDIDPQDFVEDQRTYLNQSRLIDDDICRTAIPLASIPWMEAILGCPVEGSGAGIKSREILDRPGSFEEKQFDPENPWVRKYLEFIEVYKKAFGKTFPVGQSVIRGPSDLACALLGAEKATMVLLEEAEDMQRLLTWITAQLEAFLRFQLDCLPRFRDGYVIGQYEIWAPGKVLRIQEDFAVLYSPDLYQEFLRPLDRKLAEIAPYSLLHLHATSLFLIDHFLSIGGIRAFQVSKDAGGAELSAMIPALQKIQQAGKPLILKGQFTSDDVRLMKKQLSVPGLCVQPVVKNLEEAGEMLPDLQRW